MITRVGVLKVKGSRQALSSEAHAVRHSRLQGRPKISQSAQLLLQFYGYPQHGVA